MRQRVGTELKVARFMYGLCVTLPLLMVTALAAIVIAGPIYLGLYAAYCAVMGV